MNLYDIQNEFKQLLNMQEEISEEAFKDTLESLNFDLELKADGYAKVMKALEGTAEIIKNEEIRLAEKRKQIEKRSELLKDNLYNAMKIAGLEEVKNNLFTIKIKKNPPKLVLDSGAEFKEYEKTEVIVKIDNAKIKEDLKNGKEISGARLEQGERLDVK